MNKEILSNQTLKHIDRKFYKVAHYHLTSFKEFENKNLQQWLSKNNSLEPGSGGARL